MLLAQKSYCEGALALELYCARLVDEQKTGDAAGRRRRAPAARSADADRQELAQRVVPGSQLARDPGPRRLRLHARLPGGAVLARQPPEHDPRGHARHPGGRPAGPQGADGRRPRPAAAGRAHHRHHRAAPRACRRWPRMPRRWPRRCSSIGSATKAAWATGNPQEALANAVPYMQAFGHTVLAWIWLDVAAACACAAMPPRRCRPRPGASARPTISSTTSCRRSAPGSRWSSAATRPARPARGSLLMTTTPPKPHARLEKLDLDPDLRRPVPADPRHRDRPRQRGAGLVDGRARRAAGRRPAWCSIYVRSRLKP